MVLRDISGSVSFKNTDINTDLELTLCVIVKCYFYSV